MNIILKNDIHQVKGYGGRIYLKSKLDKCSLNFCLDFKYDLLKGKTDVLKMARVE